MTRPLSALTLSALSFFRMGNFILIEVKEHGKKPVMAPKVEKPVKKAKKKGEKK